MNPASGFLSSPTTVDIGSVEKVHADLEGVVSTSLRFLELGITRKGEP